MYEANVISDIIDAMGTYLSQKLDVVWSDLHKSSNRTKTFRCGVPIILTADRSESNALIELFRNKMEKTYYLDSPYMESAHTHASTWYSGFSNESFWQLKNAIDALKQNYVFGISINQDAPRYSMSIDNNVVRLNKIEYTQTLKLYIIFWNLFLTCLNVQTFSKQLVLVSELACCFGFDEHIIADICRAVEYVLSGKKLSLDCDLHCETVECAKFFLGHK